MVERHAVQKIKVKTVEPSTQNFNGLRLVSKICELHKSVCGKDVTEDGWHGLSCLRSAGRFSRHSDLNSLIKQSLFSTHFPSVLEPRHLYMTDKKQPDGLTLVPWAVGKQLLWM